MLGTCILLCWKETRNTKAKEDKSQPSAWRELPVTRLPIGDGRTQAHPSGRWGRASFCSCLALTYKRHLLSSKKLSNFSLSSALIPPHARKNPVSKAVQNVTIWHLASPLRGSWVKQGKPFRLPLLHSFHFEKEGWEVGERFNCLLIVPRFLSKRSGPKSQETSHSLSEAGLGRTIAGYSQWCCSRDWLKIHVCIAIFYWEMPVYNSST